MFIEKRSPAYLGGAIDFLLSPMLTDGFNGPGCGGQKGRRRYLQGRRGGPGASHLGEVCARHGPDDGDAFAVDGQTGGRKGGSKSEDFRDIAAGHRLYGIAFAKNNPQAEIVALDWAPVLEVAKENARNAAVSDRYRTIEGSAFDVEYGSGYDLVLLTNFLHHFDMAACEALLRKVRAALAGGGRALTLEFVPNEDRISPPEAAGFSMMMLAGTPSGDAYTFSELERMFSNAGFARSEIYSLPLSIEQVVISHK